jgi:hypothetical protein
MPNQPVERASVVLHTDSFNFRAVVQAACAQINEQDSVNSIAIRFYLYGLQEGLEGKIAWLNGRITVGNTERTGLFNPKDMLPGNQYCASPQSVHVEYTVSGNAITLNWTNEVCKMISAWLQSGYALQRESEISALGEVFSLIVMQMPGGKVSARGFPEGVVALTIQAIETA